MKHMRPRLKLRTYHGYISTIFIRTIFWYFSSSLLIVQEKKNRFTKSTSYLEERIRYEIDLFSSLVQLPQVQQWIIARKCCVPGCKSKFVLKKKSSVYTEVQLEDKISWQKISQLFACVKRFEQKYLIPHATGKICGKTTHNYVTRSRDAVAAVRTIIFCSFVKILHWQYSNET